VCCSVLQCVAVCCSVLQCVAVCCSVLQCVAVCCSVLQCDAVCCIVLHCVAVSYSLSYCADRRQPLSLPHTHTHYQYPIRISIICPRIILQHAATRCNKLQHTAILLPVSYTHIHQLPKNKFCKTRFHPQQFCKLVKILESQLYSHYT